MSDQPASDTPPPVRVHRSSAKYILLLGSLAAVPAVTTDMYLPSLPDIEQEFGTTTAAVQLTVTMMLVGGGIGQLVNGPLSDMFGRRRPVLIGLSAHVLLSIACALAPGIVSLVALRTAQGFFNAAASVVALAVIRDRFSGSEASRLLSRLMLVIGVAPLFAPSIGGLIAGQWGWRAVFVALAAFGAGVAVLAWLKLPETLPPERRRRGIGLALSGYWRLLRDRRFVAYALVPGVSFGVIMSYVVGSPFVLQEEFGLTGQQFAIVFAVIGLGLVAAAQVNAALVRHFAPERILRTVSVLLLVNAGALATIGATGWGGLPALLAGLFLTVPLVFFLHPNAVVLALEDYGEMAGTASAFIGSVAAMSAGLLSPFVGLLGGDATAMTAVMAGCAVLCLLILVAGTPVFRRGPRRVPPAVTDLELE